MAVILRDLWGNKNLVVEPERFRLPRRDYLTIGEIAQYLRVSERTVRDWIDSGDLTAFVRNQTVRVHKNSLRRFRARNSSDRKSDERKAATRAAVAVMLQQIKDELPAEMDQAARRELAGRIWKRVRKALPAVVEEL